MKQQDTDTPQPRAEVPKTERNAIQGRASARIVPFDLLTVGDVSRKFRCSPATVWRWVKYGKLAPPIKICGFTRWHASDVEDVLKNANASRPAQKKT